MSYSRDRGVFVESDKLGTKPWTSGQRVHAFTSYFVTRRGIPGRLVTPSCDDWIVYPDTFNKIKSLRERDLTISKLAVFSGENILRQASKLRETLKRVCASPISPNTDQAIDMISGEQIICRGTTCEPPAGGATCPDGPDPPCQLVELCADNSLPPCKSGRKLCEDGTAPPCPSGEIVQCTTLQTSDIPGNQNSTQNTNTNTTTCPKACDVHFNTCDPKTAPTCIYPNPQVARPRAACACRPGWKAAAFAEGDTTKQWRLPILGQEHRVWVAEGVKCDKECTGFGVNSCKEITVISEACVG